MDYQIRKIHKNECHLLGGFLYEAIYVPEGSPRPPKEIINIPDLQVSLHNFGEEETDYRFVDDSGNEIIGAIWARIMNDYGHIDDNTPSLALAVCRPYRGYGIGTSLMRALMERLQEDGFNAVSLSVQKSNPAFRLYQRLGFETVKTVMGETEEEIVMRRPL